jgi:hypothetical protein
MSWGADDDVISVYLRRELRKMQIQMIDDTKFPVFFLLAGNSVEKSSLVTVSSTI